jgi:hypothetical protein
MLSQHTFKDALIAFRERMNPPLRFNDRGMPTLGYRSTADLQLINRWIIDERAEAVWRTLIKQRSSAESAELIKAVLKARRMAGATIARKRIFSREWSEALSSLKKHVAALPESLEPLGVAEALHYMAHEMRDLCEFHALDDGLNAPFPLSRKDQRGSRRRRLFMQIMADYFLREFGTPLDDCVATLAEIALDDPELQHDHARNARRPTTRKKARRCIRRQKSRLNTP